MSEPATFFEDRRSASGISVKLDLLHDDVSDMKAVLKELTAAIYRAKETGFKQFVAVTLCDLLSELDPTGAHC